MSEESVTCIACDRSASEVPLLRLSYREAGTAARTDLGFRLARNAE